MQGQLSCDGLQSSTNYAGYAPWFLCTCRCSLRAAAGTPCIGADNVIAANTVMGSLAACALGLLIFAPSMYCRIKYLLDNLFSISGLVIWHVSGMKLYAFVPLSM